MPLSMSLLCLFSCIATSLLCLLLLPLTCPYHYLALCSELIYAYRYDICSCPLLCFFSYDPLCSRILTNDISFIYTLHMHFFLYCLFISIVYMYPLLCYLLYVYYPWMLVPLRVNNMLKIISQGCTLWLPLQFLHMCPSELICFGSF